MCRELNTSIILDFEFSTVMKTALIASSNQAKNARDTQIKMTLWCRPNIASRRKPKYVDMNAQSCWYCHKGACAFAITDSFGHDRNKRLGSDMCLQTKETAKRNKELRSDLVMQATWVRVVQSDQRSSCDLIKIGAYEHTHESR